MAASLSRWSSWYSQACRSGGNDFRAKSVGHSMVRGLWKPSRSMGRRPAFCWGRAEMRQSLEEISGQGQERNPGIRATLLPVMPSQASVGGHTRRHSPQLAGCGYIYKQAFICVLTWGWHRKCVSAQVGTQREQANMGVWAEVQAHSHPQELYLHKAAEDLVPKALRSSSDIPLKRDAHKPWGQAGGKQDPPDQTNF